MSAKVAKGDGASPENGYRDTESAHSETLRNLDEIMRSPVRLFHSQQESTTDENFPP
jgi:hypothetical protein